MNQYHIWCNLRDPHKDLEFARHLAAYLSHLQEQGRIASYRLSRRKLGFGPQELGEFHVCIEVRDLAQLDDAFNTIAPREGQTEALHARVYSMITDFRSALYRDFPDPQRSR
jgi:hypothetical protein